MNYYECPNCGSSVGECPECGKQYHHGTINHCNEPYCKSVNAPIDCLCGYVVSDDKKGVLDYDMNFIRFRSFKY